MVDIKKMCRFGCASYDSSKLLYDRVRIVSIDCEGFMSCICSTIQMYLIPCRHMCVIISKKSYVHLQCFIFGDTSCSIIMMVKVLEWNWLHVPLQRLIILSIGLEIIALTKVVPTKESIFRI